MKNCYEIIDNLECENIKFFFKKIKSIILQDEIFFFFIKLFRDKKELCLRFIIFCIFINVCGQLVIILRFNIKEEIRYF